MLNGLNPIDSLFSNGSSGSTDPIISALGGTNSFDSIFTQAENQAKTPAQKAMTALAAVKFDNMNNLFGAVSGDSTSILPGSSMGMLGLDLGSLTAQLNHLENLLGISSAGTGPSPAPGTQPPNPGAVLGLQSQLLLNQDLSSFGSTGGSNFSTLI